MQIEQKFIDLREKTGTGDPEDCIKFVEQFEALGVEELMFNFQLGPVTHQEVMDSIRLFETHVIPSFSPP